MRVLSNTAVRLSMGAALLVSLAFSANADLQLVQAFQAQLPQPPAGGLDPSKLPDIVGVHIGTPTDQAIKQLDSLYPVVRDNHGTQQYGQFQPPAMTRYAATNDPPYRSGGLWTRTTEAPGACGGGGCGDRFDALFSGPPDQRLVRMTRTVGYPPNKQATVDTVKNALAQKYGPNFTEFPQMVLVWAFDEQGNALKLSKNEAQCARGEGPLSQGGNNPPYALQSYLGLYVPTPQQQQQLTNLLRSKCVKGVIVQAQIGGNSSGIVGGMTVMITEVAADLRNAFAAELYLQQAANAQADQQRVKDQQTPAPKF